MSYQDSILINNSIQFQLAELNKNQNVAQEDDQTVVEQRPLLINSNNNSQLLEVSTVSPKYDSLPKAKGDDESVNATFAEDLQNQTNRKLIDANEDQSGIQITQMRTDTEGLELRLNREKDIELSKEEFVIDFQEIRLVPIIRLVQLNNIIRCSSMIQKDIWCPY